MRLNVMPIELVTESFRSTGGVLASEFESGVSTDEIEADVWSEGWVSAAGEVDFDGCLSPRGWDATINTKRTIHTTRKQPRIVSVLHGPTECANVGDELGESSIAITGNSWRFTLGGSSGIFVGGVNDAGSCSFDGGGLSSITTTGNSSPFDRNRCSLSVESLIDGGGSAVGDLGAVVLCVDIVSSGNDCESSDVTMEVVAATSGGDVVSLRSFVSAAIAVAQPCGVATVSTHNELVGWSDPCVGGEASTATIGGFLRCGVLVLPSCCGRNLRRCRSLELVE